MEPSAMKSRDAFDLCFQPSIDRAQILSLHQFCVRRPQGACHLLGAGRRGEDQFVTSLSITAAERGQRATLAP